MRTVCACTHYNYCIRTFVVKHAISLVLTYLVQILAHTALQTDLMVTVA
jgi:uncharacterized membrane protein